MYDFIKRFLADDAVYFSLIIILVAVASFGLGRLSLEDGIIKNQPASVGIVETVNEDETTVTEANLEYVASKNGSKYHLLWCPGASQMNEENKIYFDSRAEAEAAGYGPAANCPDLEITNQ